MCDVITIIGRQNGKIVAKETVQDSRDASVVEKQWRDAGLEVERVVNATEVKL